MNKKWLNSEDVLKQFRDGNHQEILLGVRLVDPSKFIALSMDCDMVCNDLRMRQLKQKVDDNGWNDPNPHTLKLIQLPNGDYVVDGYGNHRALLANERQLSQIPALVRRIFHISTFPQALLVEVSKLRKEYGQINAFLEEKFDSYNPEHEKMVVRTDEISAEILKLYYDYVKNNNLI